jgi:hypothetical protein
VPRERLRLAHRRAQRRRARIALEGVRDCFELALARPNRVLLDLDTTA